MEISPGTQLVALLGDPVSHSLSPRMHAAAFAALGLRWAYVALRVLPSDLAEAVRGLRALGFAGANVTVPHKEAVVPLVDRLDEVARACGAVNTLVFGESRRIHGYNTDVAGVRRTLEHVGFRAAGCRAAVLGAGGSARAVCVALAQEGVAEVLLFARRVERAEFLAGQMSTLFPQVRFAAYPLEPASLRAQLAEAELLVNATPVGMHPDRDASPIPSPEFLHPCMVVFDLVYNPPRTRLLQLAQQAGARTIGGLLMLAYQGASSFELWTGKSAPVEVMLRAIGAPMEE
ncbi:MAG: shikimate dehydrogenase [Armatimonadota bacterium]|nr:shikimate dehydrogenase [Armatimonadota bacterium]MDR7563475.1 shikimate dehydrogenase [Armatimonadota bacterium]MDR7601610.1 shikimate dehydrogenase [Armatimonadota bacterium]